jgi:hypothetical protein
MRPQDQLDKLSQIVSSGEISNLSEDQLEKYAAALCFSAASDYFSATQFAQVCETIRLLLLKKYTEKIDKQNAEMQGLNLTLQRQNTDLQSQNIKLQYVVIVLMVLTILTASIQIYVALKPNSQTEQQIELLQGIQSRLSASPHPKNNSSAKK